MSLSKSIFTVAIILMAFSCRNNTNNDKFWTEDKSPETIARKVIDDFFTHTDFWMCQTDQFYSVHYAEACAAFGIVRFAGLTNDKETIDKIASRYLKIITDTVPVTGNHVDANVYGILPLEIYILTKDERFLKQGLWLADQQWENPLKNGLSNQTRFWIDDIWMIGSLQTQAYRATGKMKYLERAALELDAYIQKLQQPNGLFFHGPEAPFHWGRGNGWVAAGMAELLSELPDTNPHYNSIIIGYEKMMDALVQYQAEDGMWRQLIDVDTAWKETSSTAMFGYAMTMGVKSGILKEKKYSDSYKRAWNVLVEYLDENGKITEVCIGTGQQNDVDFYLNRPREIGNFHGQAPLIWFAYSLLEK